MVRKLVEIKENSHNHRLLKFKEALCNHGYDFDRWPEVEPIIRFAMMAVLGMAPMPEPGPDISMMKDIGLHIEYDFRHNWPLSGATSLRADEYAEVYEALKDPKLAHRCHCGNTIAYGRGHGIKLRDGVTGVFCSKECKADLPGHKPS